MNAELWNNCSGDYKLSLSHITASAKSQSLKDRFLQSIEYVPFNQRPMLKKLGRFRHFSESTDVQENTIIVEEEIPDFSDN